MLKKLDLYIIKKFLGTFIFAIALIIIIVIIFDISEKIDDFIEKKAGLYNIIFEYYLNFIPYFVNLFSPLFTFIAVVFFTSKLAANTEIIAILSSGISFRRLLRPYLISALLIGVMTFYLANFLIPKVNVNRLKFEKQYIRGKGRTTHTDIHLQLDRNIFLYMESFDLDNNTGYRFSLEKINETGLYYKLTADQIIYDSINDKWLIRNYIERTINGLKETFKRDNEMLLTMAVKPLDLSKETKDVEVMDYKQLRDFIKQEKIRGSDRVKFYEIEKYQRISYPFATLILTLIGASLASKKVRGGIGLNLALGLVITFSFILFMKISTVFATFGNLPPLLATWIPIFIFGILSVYIIKKTPK
jgi:lipopolysaccharide export system permease protein